MLALKELTMLGNTPQSWDKKPLKKLLLDTVSGDWGQDRGPHLYPVLRSTNLTNSGRLDLEDIAQRALEPADLVDQLIRIFLDCYD